MLLANTSLFQLISPRNVLFTTALKTTQLRTEVGNRTFFHTAEPGEDQGRRADTRRAPHTRCQQLLRIPGFGTPHERENTNMSMS